MLTRGGGSHDNAPVMIQSGTGVGYSLYLMHRRQSLYGTDANEFRPEQWKDGEVAKRIGWGYLPFSVVQEVALVVSLHQPPSKVTCVLTPATQRTWLSQQLHIVLFGSFSAFHI